MFVLLFAYVFGGAISTPGYDYVDFLMPGIIVQNIAFGGFVTALGLAEDLNKGLIDRFRSLPMARRRGARRAHGWPTSSRTRSRSRCWSRPGSSSASPSTRARSRSLGGVGLLLLFGYAFSWVFAFLGMLVSSPESANALGFTARVPDHVHLLGVRAGGLDARPARLVRRGQPGHGDGRRHARAVARRPGGRQRVGPAVWCLVIIAIFAPLAVARYRRTAARVLTS